MLRLTVPIYLLFTIKLHYAMPASLIPATCRIDNNDSALQQRRKNVERFTLCCFIHTLPNVLFLGSYVSSVRIVAKNANQLRHVRHCQASYYFRLPSPMYFHRCFVLINTFKIYAQAYTVSWRLNNKFNLLSAGLLIVRIVDIYNLNIYHATQSV